MGEPQFTSIAGVLLPRRATWAAFSSFVVGIVLCTAFVMRIDARLSNIEDASMDRWTRTDMRIWRDHLEELTREKGIPIPKLQPHYSRREESDDER